MSVVIFRAALGHCGVQKRSPLSFPYLVAALGPLCGQRGIWIINGKVERRREVRKGKTEQRPVTFRSTISCRQCQWKSKEDALYGSLL